MKLQHISSTIPNVIPISKIRKDIDSLLDLLENYDEVSVLKGQNILFKVIKAEDPQEKQRKINATVASIRKFRERYDKKRGRTSASEWLIRERDRMRTKEYYAEHNR